MTETDKKDSNLPFDGITAEALSKLIESKSIHALAALGGCESLLKQLKTSQNLGLEPLSQSEKQFTNQATVKNDTFHERRAIFGTNKLPEPKLKSFWEFVWKALHDKTLIILMAAAVLDIAIGIYKLLAPERDPYSIIGGCAIVIASK
jgi:P-type Ca2+ transporter type 2C